MLHSNKHKKGWTDITMKIIVHNVKERCELSQGVKKCTTLRKLQKEYVFITDFTKTI